DDDRRLPRRDEPDERAGLEIREQADEQVRPLAERLARVLEQLLEVRERDDAGADQRGGRHDHPAGALDQAAEFPAPDDQERRQRHSAEHPAPLHTGSTAIAPGILAAAARAASRSSKAPNTVGPDPETIVYSAPAAATCRITTSIPGHSDRAASCRS